MSDPNTLTMTPEEFGCYCILVFITWMEKEITTDINELTQLCRGVCPSQKVLRCFREKNGKFFHKKLDRERRKQAHRRAFCKKGGLKSAHKRKNPKEIGAQHSSSTGVQHLSVELECNTLSLSSTSVIKNKAPVAPLSKFLKADPQKRGLYIGSSGGYEPDPNFQMDPEDAKKRAALLEERRKAFEF